MLKTRKAELVVVESGFPGPAGVQVTEDGAAR